MGLIDVERRAGRVWLRLNRGKTHTLDSALLTELSGRFHELADDPECRAVVLAGAGDRFFCNGLDVPTLLAMSRGELSAFLHLFLGVIHQLYLFPRPLVAAINGHCMAGGLILALTADYRIVGDENRFLGFSEINLGLPVPRGAVLMLSDLVGNRIAHRLVLDAETLLPEAAYRLGLVQEVVAFRHLEVVADTVAGERGNRPPEAYALSKRYLRAQAAEMMVATEPDSREEFLNAWFLPGTQAALRKLAERRTN